MTNLQCNVRDHQIQINSTNNLQTTGVSLRVSSPEYVGLEEIQEHSYL